MPIDMTDAALLTTILDIKGSRRLNKEITYSGVYSLAIFTVAKCSLLRLQPLMAALSPWRLVAPTSFGGIAHRLNQKRSAMLGEDEPQWAQLMGLTIPHRP